VSATTGGPRPADGVTHWLVGQLIAPNGARKPLDVDLIWEPAEPLCVQVRFVAADVTWLLGRELLGEGLIRPTGYGDVRVASQEGAVELQLASPSGCALVRLDAAEVTDFLAATYRVIGPDEAAALVHVQLEAALAALLDQAGGVS
jgi:hypothetical protein